MKTIWHSIIPFRWRNLLPWRHCVTCGKWIGFLESWDHSDAWWSNIWCWIRWGIPEHCSKECADLEIVSMTIDGEPWQEN